MNGFQAIQRQLAGHIRNPDQTSAPSGIEPRRLKIYRELFYNNIEGFLSGGFPVLRSIIADEPWHAMVRDFLIKHECHTPYFLEISQEFLAYLQTSLQESSQPSAADLPFMLELAHYEWVELALDIADEDLELLPVDHEGDLLEQLPVVSPLAWSLAYQYPVHHIGPDFLPQEPGEQPTYLIVYRNRGDQVEFMEANAVTARLLELLGSEQVSSGQEALTTLAGEMQHPQPEQMLADGSALLQQLASLDIILGTGLK